MINDKKKQKIASSVIDEKKMITVGGSRAAKKRRKDNSRSEKVTIKEDNGEKKNIIISSDKKKTKFSADTLNSTAIALVEASASSSSSESHIQTQRNRMKLSIKEVLALEEITEIDCLARASTVLSIILSPYERNTFYSDYWQKRPMHCATAGDKKESVKGLLSSKQFCNIIKSQSILYDQDIITSNAKEDTSQTSELLEAKESDLWSQFQDGSTLRLQCPQKFHDPLWSLLSILEFEFGSKVACYVDFLPSGGKGFKPRFDHFDSFVIQLEGQSKWMLYSYLEGNELPRSPHEFEVSELPTVISVEAVLKPGDSLYIPKGWIKRQENSFSESSLYLNVHTNEANCVADLLEIVMPEALKEAVECSTAMRRSLPRGFHTLMGVASSENDEDPLR